MKKIIKLSAGDLYTSDGNAIGSIFDEHYKLISKIMPSAFVLLVDDRYFRTVTVYSGIDVIPCKDLEEARRRRSAYEIYVKIAYNDVIGYTNVINLFPVEKQS